MSGKTVADMSEVIRRALESRAGDIYTALPGIVQTYDSASQVVDVQPAIRRWLPTIDDDISHEDLPVLPNVPVVFPGAGAIAITWPISVGDEGLIVIATYAFAQWRQSGNVSDPGDTRLHSLGNAVFIPGLRSNKNKIDASQAGANALVLEASEIRLGKDATSYIALADKVNTELNHIKNTLNSLTGGVSTPATFGTTYSPGDVSATKAKAK